MDKVKIEPVLEEKQKQTLKLEDVEAAFRIVEEDLSKQISIPDFKVIEEYFK